MTLSRSILAILERTRLGRAAINFVIDHGRRPDAPPPLVPPKGLTERELRAWRVEHRLCRKCGVELEESDGKFCETHRVKNAASRKRYREKHPDRVKAQSAATKNRRQANPEPNRAYQRERYKKTAPVRICEVDGCDLPAKPWNKVCAQHVTHRRREVQRLKMRRWRKHQRTTAA